MRTVPCHMDMDLSLGTVRLCPRWNVEIPKFGVGREKLEYSRIFISGDSIMHLINETSSNTSYNLSRHECMHACMCVCVCFFCVHVCTVCVHVQALNFNSIIHLCCLLLICHISI